MLAGLSGWEHAVGYRIRLFVKARKQTNSSLRKLGRPQCENHIELCGVLEQNQIGENIQDHAGGGEGGTLLLEWSGKSLQKNPGTAA